MTVQAAKDNIINLVGTVEGLMLSFAGTNFDGTTNTLAQTQAIQNSVAALVSAGLFQVPTGVSVATIQTFAPSLVSVIQAYLTSTKKLEL